MVRLPALPTSIRLGWKRMAVANTLVDYDREKIAIKRFIKQAPCVISVLNRQKQTLDITSNQG